MNRITKVVIIALSLAVFSYAALGYVLSRTADEKSYRSLTVYGEVLNKIQEDYVEEPNMAKVSSGALHGLLESLPDSMSSYMSAPEYADYKKSLDAHPAGQIGVVLAKNNVNLGDALCSEVEGFNLLWVMRTWTSVKRASDCCFVRAASSSLSSLSCCELSLPCCPMIMLPSQNIRLYSVTPEAWK